MMSPMTTEQETRRFIMTGKHDEPDVEDVDQAELIDIVAEAVDARNGWKRILQRCSPPKRQESRSET